MKAALANLTKTLALELGDRQIRVNCIAPDVIPTPGIGDVPVKTPLPFAGDTRRHRGRGGVPRVRLVALRHRHDDPRRRRQPRGRRMGAQQRRWLHDRGCPGDPVGTVKFAERVGPSGSVGEQTLRVGGEVADRPALRNATSTMPGCIV